MSILSVPILIRGRHVMDSQSISSTELQERRAAMCRLLDEHEIDGVICYADSSCNGYVEYFTNYNCATPFTNAMFLLMADGNNCLIASVPPRDTQRMRNGFIPDDIGLLTVGMSPLANDHVGQKAVDYMTEKGIIGKRWGGINLSRCMKKTLDDLECALPCISDLTTDFERLRSVKTASEIDIIRQAASIAKKAAQLFADTCGEGVEECVAAARADRMARFAGAEDIQVFVGTSESGNYLRLPKKRSLKGGEIVKILCQVQYLRYRGCFATTVIVGNATGALSKQIEINAEKFNRLINYISAGSVYDEEWKQALGADENGHSAIYGLGQDLKEAPSNAVPLTVYEENMVLGATFESDCAIFADTLLCTKSGACSLSGQTTD